MFLLTFLLNAKKHAKYTYTSLPSPVEMNSSGCNTLTTCIPFHTNYDYGADYQLIKTWQFLKFLTQNTE